MTDGTSDESQDLADEVILGKVVAFANEREFVMNIGEADGVEVGMRFVVLKPGGVEVRDDDGARLGTVEAPKTVVKVVRVEDEHLSVGRTFKVIRGRPAIQAEDPIDVLLRNQRMSFGVLGVAGRDLPAVPDRVETFTVSKKDTLHNYDMNVQKGDIVRLTKGEEFVFPGWARDE